MTKHNDIENFQRIYNALYHGRTTYFKSNPKDYIKMRSSMAVIETHAKNNPNSVTAKALQIFSTETAIKNRNKKLAQPQRELEETRLEKWVFAEVHRYCASHSGFFSRTSNSKNELSICRDDLKRIEFDGLSWVVRPKSRSTIIEDHLKIASSIGIKIK